MLFLNCELNVDSMFALVDCNNFFVSCEKVFRPDLEGRPVAVLSNNDGCVVARSNEVKKLGIPMAAPFFKYRDLAERHKIVLFSANFPLYGDFSNRIMSILKGINAAKDVQVYSIDEAFMQLSETNPAKLEQFGKELRKLILQWTGIPVSIGLGPTKTLAKVANELVKHRQIRSGVFYYGEVAQRGNLLQSIPVGEIWGIGFRLSKFLQAHGIFNAWQLMQMPESWVKQNLSISGLRTVLELKGTSCLPLHHLPSTRKSLLTSRSFGYPVTSYNELKEAVASYCSRAAEKLRREGLAATYVTVFIETNRFHDSNRYYNSATRSVIPSSNYNPQLITASLRALEGIFRDRLQYRRAGVIFQGLVPESEIQLDLFHAQQDFGKQQRLMQTLDLINGKWGKRCLRYAATGMKKPWHLKQEHRSPRYTTSWSELYTIKAN